MPIKKDADSFIMDIANYLHDNVQTLNNSKLFAGLMIITLNIASRFVNIKLSNTMEAYLKYSFSRQVLVFAIAWMGTRDIYVAFFITVVFVVMMEFLFHEESMFCVFPEHFREYHMSLLESGEIVTDEEIKKAKEVLERAEKQKKPTKTSTTEESAPPTAAKAVDKYESNYNYFSFR